MSIRAKYFGAAGTVVDGRICDLDEQRALDYLVFAHGVSTAPLYESVKAPVVNVPVKLHTEHRGMEISPGDYLTRDINGVVLLPKNWLGLLSNQ